MYGITDMPPIDGGDLERLIDENVDHREYLFFRRNPGDDLDPFLGHEDGYECFCTRCQEHFLRPLKDGPASKWTSCPNCGGKIKSSRWGKANFLAAEAFLFSFFLRGRGREVWLVSVQVRMNPHFLESKYCARESSRIVFYDGGAKKWRLDYAGCAHQVKRVGSTNWPYGMGNFYPSFSALDESELRGTCLEYSCLKTANYALEDLASYLALYCRYPAAVEHLVKRGFIFWLRERESCGGAIFNRLINLRADSPKKLFRGLDRADLRVLRDANASLLTALFYRELKKAGAARADEDSAYFAMSSTSVFRFFAEFVDLCGFFDVTPKETRRYIERQARRADQFTGATLTELRDYRAQLERLSLAGGELPADLHEAHMRLTRREAQLKHHAENAKFRARRHLLRWMKWRHGGCFIRPVDSLNEITLEGEVQDNCVAMYADWHAQGKTVIMLLRRCSAPGTSWHTVEIDPKTLDCLQCYGYKNRKRTPEAAEFMVAYLDHLREAAKMNGRKVM